MKFPTDFPPILKAIQMSLTAKAEVIQLGTERLSELNDARASMSLGDDYEASERESIDLENYLDALIDAAREETAPPAAADEPARGQPRAGYFAGGRMLPRC